MSNSKVWGILEQPLPLFKFPNEDRNDELLDPPSPNAVSYTPPHVARDSLGTPWGLLGDSLGTPCILWTPWGLLWDSLGTPLGLLGDSFGPPLGLLGSAWGLHQESIKSLHGVYGDY